MPDTGPTPPNFDEAFRAEFADLLRWRRDVRRFRSDPIDGEVVDGLLAIAALAPSVGNSQPWRFVKVDDPARRATVRADFEACNKDALGDYSGDKARIYAGLKLAGLDAAPVQLAVFTDLATASGHGLGQATMPETLAYSVVGAINALWLAARSRGIGVGWVSILDPARVTAALDVPDTWSLVAYLCMGYPIEEHLDPELERHGWQDRLDLADLVIQR